MLLAPTRRLLLLWQPRVPTLTLSSTSHCTPLHFTPRGHPNNTAAAMSSAVDAKLMHLVRKFVSFSVDASPNADHIVHCLRTQHREYQRKDLVRLKRQVQKALKRISKDAADDSARSKKRAVEEANEAQYDKKARKHDMERSMLLNDGSALNAGLRNRYRKMQHQRTEDGVSAAGNAGAASEAGAAAVESSNNGGDGTAGHGGKERSGSMAESQRMDAQNHNVKLKKPPPNGRSSGAGAGEPGTTAAPIVQTTSSRSGSRKRKSASMKRSSSSNNNSNSNNGAFDGLGDEKGSAHAVPVRRPTERYADLGGMDETLKQIQQLIEYPLVRPEVYRYLGVDPPRGVLLRGPPGCGKTHLANAIAGQLGVPYFCVSAPELVSGMSGESEGRIRDLFQAASESAPALIFMDELDAIAPKRGDGRGMEKRMVAQLLTSMDSIAPKYNRNHACVMVIGATNRPDSIDAALRRAGRFDREILLGVPDEEARLNIIQTMTKDMKLAGDFDYKLLARKTPGFVGADIRSLTKEAAVIAINRIFANVLKDQSLASLRASGSAKMDSTTGVTGANTANDTGTGNSNDAGDSKNDDTADNDKPSEDLADNKANSSGNDNDNKAEPNGANVETNGTKDSSTMMDVDPQTSAPLPLPSPSPVIDDISSIVPLTDDHMKPLFIGMPDFLEALPHVQPSSKREGFATVPDVSWDDIGALGTVREELVLSVLEPIRNPEKFQALGIPLPAGVMLYGPPGCGKTLLAKAIANESGANFISVKGPELLDKYVGESERSVRLVFERARSSSPCVVFFDELDSLCPRRGSDGGGGGGVSERVVNQMLTEMDGLDSRRSVFVIAATNRPELIDPAMVRPGRLDKLLYVPLPTPSDRASILTALAKNIRISDDIDLAAIGSSARAEGYSGADCAALLREAGLAVVKEGLSADGDAGAGDGDKFDVASLCIKKRHFQYAFKHVMPSVSKKDQARYDRIRDRMARARSRGNVDAEDDDVTTTASSPAAASTSISTSADASETPPTTDVKKVGDSPNNSSKHST